jgi:hypothetical protein
MKYKLFVVVAAAAFPGSYALAQTAATPEVEATASEKLSAGKSALGNDSPADRAGSAISGSLLQFSAEKGKTEATLALKFDLDRYEPVKVTRAGFWRKSSLDLVVSATAPLNGEDTNSPLFGNDHLVKGSSLRLAITRTSALVNDGSAAQPFIFEAQRSCVKSETEKWAIGKNTEEARTLAGLYQSDFSKEFNPPQFLAGPTIRGLAKPNKFGDKEGSLGVYIVTQCTNSDVGKLVKDYNFAQHETYVKTIKSEKPLIFMGIDGSIGRAGFKALDRTTFKVDDAARNSWEIAAYYGWIGPNADWSLRARAVYGKAWESPDEVQICRTVTGSTDQECIKGPDGKPQSTKTGLASFEARKFFTLLGGQKIAVAPQITYRLKDKGIGVEVPVYLSTDKEGKLSGGLKFAYDSKTDDYGVGIFVGAPFSIFFE